MSEHSGKTYTRREILRMLGYGLLGAGGVALAYNGVTRLGVPTIVKGGIDRIEELLVSDWPVVIGVPREVPRSKLTYWANEPLPGSGEVYENNIGLNTEGWIAYGGVSPKDWETNSSNPSWWDSTFDHKQLLTTPRAVWPLIEGGFAVFIGEKMKLKFKGMQVFAPELKNNRYIVIVRGKQPKDNLKSTDNSLGIEVSGYLPGFTTAMMLPPGPFIDGLFFYEMVGRVEGEFRFFSSELGPGDWIRVTVGLVDAENGAYTLIRKDEGEAPWVIGRTNVVQQV